MNIEQATEILKQIETTTLHKLKQDLFNAASRYARFRTDWFFMSDDEKRDQDPQRTAAGDDAQRKFDLLRSSRLGIDKTTRSQE